MQRADNGRGMAVSWSIEGSYVENCNCDVVCPCTWSGFNRKATHERCLVLGGFHIDRGEIEGVDVSGLHFGLVIDAPQQMTDGNWRVGVLVDEAASDQQAEKLQAVASGQLGGPITLFGPFIGEALGVARVPVSWQEEDGRHQIRFGDVADVTLQDMESIEGKKMTLGNVPHPAGPSFTLSPSTAAAVSAFGVSFGAPDTNGITTPFSWSA